MNAQQVYSERLKAARARMGMAPKAPVVVIVPKPVTIFKAPEPEPVKSVVGVKRFAGVVSADHRRYSRLRTAARELEKARAQHAASFKRNRIDLAVVATSAHFGIAKAEILGDSRYAHIAYPRHVAMYIAHRFMKMSLSGIGRFFDRDHTTVRTATMNIDAMRTDGAPLIERDIAGILSLLSEFDLNLIGYWGA